jgi:hypothetical protein
MTRPQDRPRLLQATRRHIDELMEEAARTESRPMQHELARLIDRLQAIVPKLGGATASA